MEQAGVGIDSTVLGEMSNRLAVEIDNLAERIYTQAGAAMGADSGHRFNINSPKQLGDVLFNKMLLPKPMKYGKGKVVSTAQDVLEELAEQHPVPALVLEYRQLAKLKSTYLDSLPQLTDSQGRVHTTFNQVGTATGRLSSTNPNLQNIPIRTALGREIRAAFIPAPGNVSDVGRLFADRAAADGSLFAGPVCCSMLIGPVRTFIPLLRARCSVSMLQRWIRRRERARRP